MFGLYLWWRTQKRIERTSAAISTQVKAAIGDINGRVDQGMNGVEERFSTALKANLGALSIDAGALAEAIGPQVSTHINMALKQAEAQQGKRVGAFLKNMGLDDQLGELEAGAREQAMAALPAQAQVLMEIMNTKIPKSATTSERVLMQAAKITAAQLLQTGMATVAGGEKGVVAAASGFGVR